MKYSKIKNVAFGLLAGTSLLIYGCGGNADRSATTADSKDVAEDHNEAKFEKAAENDAQFLVNAASLNMEEVQLGNLASTKGETKEVRDLGKVVAESHSKAQAEIEALAGKKGITLPANTTDENMRAYNSLKDENNITFDKKYADALVDGHKEAITKFIKASTDAVDPDIRDWASRKLPELRAHLDQAMNCQKQLSAMKD